MSKSTRNLIIVLAVVVVIGAAAVPFIIKATKAKNADATTEPQFTESTTVDEFTYPDETSTTEELLTEIVTSLEDAEQETTTAPSTTTKPSSAETTTKKNTATTTKSSATTTKKATSEKDADSEDFQNLEKVDAQEALADSAVVSYLWDPNGHFYYTEDNPWQRQFGFNVLYDWGAPLTIMFYDTVRAKFDYDNLQWMIQLWKGQYGYLFVGCEIGVYTRDIGATGTHYNCADDNHLINMEMTLFQNFNDGKGYIKLFTRTYYPHWWSTGFVDGHLTNYKFNDRSCLYMYARLTMYDDTMTTAFTTALAGCGFAQVSSTSQLTPTGSDSYCISGKDVYIGWKTTDQGTSSSR